MVHIDYSFATATGLKRVADTLVGIFGQEKAQAGVVTPAEACPFVVITPKDGSTIEQMNDVLIGLKRDFAKAENAENIEFLLEAVRIHPETDNLPPSVILQASPLILEELASKLAGYSTLEAA